MSYYGIIFPEFWTGRTGRELRDRGGRDAQLLCLYLATNRHANMLGLYHLLVDDLKHETGLSFRAIEKGYHVANDATFASFDSVSGFVWVRQMARFRLGLKNGDCLDANDKRVIAINRIYHALDPNPFLGEFYDLNRKLLCLKKRRETEACVVVPFTQDHYMSGFKGPSKALGSQITDNRSRDQITENRNQELRRHG